MPSQDLHAATLCVLSNLTVVCLQAVFVRQAPRVGHHPGWLQVLDRWVFHYLVLEDVYKNTMKHRMTINDDQRNCIAFESFDFYQCIERKTLSIHRKQLRFFSQFRLHIVIFL